MNDINFLFWNIRKNNLSNEIENLVSTYNSNIIILFESNINKSNLLAKLNIGPKKYTDINQLVFKKGLIITNLKQSCFKEIAGTKRYGIYLFDNGVNEKMLFAFVHFHSKINYGNPLDQHAECAELANLIESLENKESISKSIVLGDFNVNPFESGISNGDSFYAISSREIAQTGSGKVNGNYKKFFYNPMWNYFGEYSKGQLAGTYFFNSYKAVNYYWNIYDQVLLRPQLLDNFDDNELEVITKVNGKSLLKKTNFTTIDKSISDHLPITFKLKF